jgi:hypothetical protein
MIYTYKDIPKIVFPIYRLFSDNWHTTDGLVYVDNIIVDDRNMPGDSLGLRRLQSSMGPFLTLRKGTSSISTMLIKYKHFIDSSGALITYEKTKYQHLKCFKIQKVELKDTASLIWLKDISTPFIRDRPPPPGAGYARVLYFNKTPWIIYDFTASISEDSRRMI